MSPRFLRVPAVVSLMILCLVGLLAVSAVSAGRPSEPLLPVSPANLPSPITITGSPLRIAVGSDSSIQVYYNGPRPGLRLSGWQRRQRRLAARGQRHLWPGCLFQRAVATNMYTVRPWMTVSHSGPTGSGTAGDPWVITTVLDAGSMGVRVTQRASYVNGQAYFRLEWAVTNASGSSQTVNLFHAADSYFANDDYGRGDYDPASGAVGRLYSEWAVVYALRAHVARYRLPRRLVLRHLGGIGYCGTTISCPCRDRAPPGRGSTAPSTPARMAWTMASGCNGSGRSGRAPARRSGTGGRSAASPTSPARTAHANADPNPHADAHRLPHAHADGHRHGGGV